jgi:putative flippase GtrA
MNQNRSTIVVLPTYNEIGSLPLVAARLRSAVPDVHLLVVDDSSPDGTGVIAERIARQDPKMHVLHRRIKQGLGPAYIAGFAHALALGFDVVVQSDADGSHRPEDLPGMLTALDAADVVVGSRWVSGGGAPAWAPHRYLVSRAGSAYARLMLGLPQHEVTGGRRCQDASWWKPRGTSPGGAWADSSGRKHCVWTIASMSERVSTQAPATTTDRVPPSWRRLGAQLTKFTLIGGIGFVADVTVFNALLQVPMHTSGWPLAAKTASTLVAIIINWLGNHWWTFRRHKSESAGGGSVFREGVEFFVASLVGSSVALICLGISHYVLNLTSPFADNISANVVGLVLGSALRFVAYRWWVFMDR